ncbi:hypothetical protein [Devosia sp. 2618]|uniref:hypothetical protein n=1 Tax=Devosia sp. 2618 TaxID=3156454 RepID=UPI003397E748
MITFAHIASESDLVKRAVVASAHGAVDAVWGRMSGATGIMAMLRLDGLRLSKGQFAQTSFAVGKNYEIPIPSQVYKLGRDCE